MITFRKNPKFDTTASIIFIAKEQIENKFNLNFKNPEVTEELKDLIKTNRFSAEKGDIFPFINKKQLILFVGLGTKDEITLKSLRITVKNTLSSSFLRKIKDIEIIPHKNEDSVVTAIIEGLLIGTYTWKKYRTPEKNEEEVGEKTFCVVANEKDVFRKTITICEGVNYTRNLINDNADLITADYFEKEIRQLTKGNKKISLEILGKKELITKGLNLHLAVNQGSNKEPKLIIVKYSGSNKKDDFISLIGKGITFDSGGINLKPSGHIETMRCDMSGAAAIIGILKNTIALELKKNIIFVCALAENAIGSCAYKPGDVIKSYSGKTVEIGNTDAEGRLVLADALSYTVKNYKPKKIIDIATLTGACVVALGYDYTGLMTPDDNFARKLIRASNETDDKAWRLPIYPELKESIKSEIADLKNISNQKGAGGTITAGEFLRQFTNDTTWAHLDIAGTAFIEGKSHSYFNYGATGAGVRLLTEYLINN